MKAAGPTTASLAGVNLKINGQTMVGTGGVIGFSQNVSSPNVVIGFGSNIIDAGVVGGSIGGGGAVGSFSGIPTVAHQVSDNFGTVSGGSGNKAGNLNLTLDDAPWATVSGGLNNTASGQWSTIGGGYSNDASASSATIGGGYDNTASSVSATVAGGQFNVASGGWSGVGGGARNVASGELAYVGGGGGTDNVSMGNTASGNGAFIGGGQSNIAGATFGTIGGGQSNVAGNNTNLPYITVGGGWSNEATLAGSTIAGGYDNTVNGSGAYGTIAGGFQNTASGLYAAVGGGTLNTASGQFAAVPGGNSNSATATASFAAGNRAKSNNSGAFVWGDSTAADISSTASNQFIVRASGGVWFGTTSTPANDLTAGRFLATSTGAYLTTGGTWTNSSDRNVKENFRQVSGRQLLEKLDRIPVETWNYKTEGGMIRHMGPMAQDFRAAFGLGEDDKHIATVDADGVALAGVQALYRMVQERDERIASQEQRLEEQAARIERLERLLSGQQRAHALRQTE